MVGAAGPQNKPGAALPQLRQRNLVHGFVGSPCFAWPMPCGDGWSGRGTAWSAGLRVSSVDFAVWAFAPHLLLRAWCMPRPAPAAASTALDRAQVHRRNAAVAAALELEAHLLILGQSVQPGSLHGRDVHENVFRAVARRDESISLGGVEELHGTGWHCIFSGKQVGRAGAERIASRYGMALS